MQACPSRDVLRQVFAADVSDSDSKAVRDHLRQCENCRRNLDGLTDDPDLLGWKNDLFSATRRSVVDGCPELVARILRESPIIETHGESDASTDRSRTSLPPFSLPIGVRLGSFELLQEIGRGGMGVVYKARDVELDRLVAVKVVPFHDFDDKARRRFLREAQAAARVKHDHVVTIHAVETAADGSPYLVLEFVNGTTLRELVKSRGPLSPRMAAELLAQGSAAAESGARGPRQPCARSPGSARRYAGYSGASQGIAGVCCRRTRENRGPVWVARRG